MPISEFFLFSINFGSIPPSIFTHFPVQIQNLQFAPNHFPFSISQFYNLIRLKMPIYPRGRKWPKLDLAQRQQNRREIHSKNRQKYSIFIENKETLEKSTPMASKRPDWSPEKRHRPSEAQQMADNGLPRWASSWTCWQNYLEGIRQKNTFGTNQRI